MFVLLAIKNSLCGIGYMVLIWLLFVTNLFGLQKMIVPSPYLRVIISFLVLYAVVESISATDYCSIDEMHILCKFKVNTTQIQKCSKDVLILIALSR